MPTRKKFRPKLLSSSRPPLSASSTAPSNLSSKTTKSVIRTHHTLHKQLSQALASNDAARAKEIENQLAANGGVRLYQQASTLGQSAQRGGDTSRVLVEWLKGCLSPSFPTPGSNDGGRGDAKPKQADSGGKARPLRILEVGALSSTNALTIPGATQVRRIDLRSNDPGIEERDFMHLDPNSTEQWEGGTGYDVLSLSLVVNYVGDPRARGAMLAHTTLFLRPRLGGDGSTNTHESGDVGENEKKAHGQTGNGERLLPALFLVLPLPCVDNSRYLTEERLTDMMKSLGYEKTRVKRTQKLYYSLWTLNDARAMARESGVENKKSSKVFKKEELLKGKDRNNFCIILDEGGR